jgi:hypothetical protein
MRCKACGESDEDVPICKGCDCCQECCNCTSSDCDCDSCVEKRSEVLGNPATE